MPAALRQRLAIGLALVTLAVYAQVGFFGFVSYDDPLYVTGNAQVLRGLTLDGFAWAFAEPGYNWYPLTWLSHMLDVELFGLWAGGHHLVGLGLHVANTVLLFWVLGAATRKPGRSAVVAALFALHPLHVETVAWVAGRKDLLSTGLGFLAVAAYVHYAARPGARRYFAILVAFGGALMAKSMLVTLPCVFLLLDYWPLRRTDRVPARRLVVEKLPLLAISVGIGLLAIATQRAEGAMVDAGVVPLGARVANAIVSYVAYLGDALWPAGLSILRPHPSLPETGGTPLGVWQVCGAGALLLAISGAAVASRRRYAIVGWLFYLGTLAPVIGLIQVGVAGRADRYTYLPLTGIFIAFTWGAAELWELARDRTGGIDPKPDRRRAWLAVAALVAVCAALTLVQARHWRASIPLFEHAVRSHPSVVTHVGLGELLAGEGELARAEAHYRAALELDPESPQAHANLGRLLLGQRNGAEALRHFERSLASAPDRVESHVHGR